jgi:hypothetical protein
MALEEDAIMKHRMLSEKIQVVTSTLASGVIKNEELSNSIGDMLAKMILEEYNYGK